MDPASPVTSTVPLVLETRFTVTAKSAAGCEGKAQTIVRIYSPVYMPTAFTPNDDGLNDVYRIPFSAGVELKEFSIFDRWGNRVFTTTDATRGWDGKVKGIRRDTGIFVYQVRGKDLKGEIFMKGTFMLIR